MVFEPRVHVVAVNHGEPAAGEHLLEIEDLRAYVTAKYGEGQKSCKYKSDQKEGTFYFISDTLSFKPEDKRADDATLKLKYIGRRLDGQAFDTNDQAAAMEEGLFVSERSYETSSIHFSSNYSSISMDGSSIQGRALQDALGRPEGNGHLCLGPWIRVFWKRRPHPPVRTSHL